MTKKSQELSRRARLKKVRSEDIRNRPLGKRDQGALRTIARQQAAGDDSHINFEDIPPLSEEQLASMVRLRDIRDRKIPVSVRLDPKVVVWLKSKGAGHLTRINDILLNVMEAEDKIRG